MKFGSTLQLFYLVVFNFYPAAACDGIATLKSVSVVFRHGDKAPMPYEYYPNDPHKNYPLEPMGYGGLTNSGKMREYQFGSKLRERYNIFLGDIYRSRDVSVISTDTERTKMSLSLVLASLYPPKVKQVWNSNFNWQPIPINWIPPPVEGLINPEECPSYQNELKAVIASKDYQKNLYKFNGLMKNLTSLTGREVNKVSTIFKIFHLLVAENAMKLELPKWTKFYFPDGPMKHAVLFEYQTRSYTTKLKKLNGGLLLRRVLNNILFAEKNNVKKVNLYSVHEINIVALLQALNLWKTDIPAYGSTVIFELHKCNEKHYLKTIYYKGIPPIFETRIIPGCSEYCPVDDFLNILKNVIPDDTVETCFGPPTDSLLIPKSEDPIAWVYRILREGFNV